MSRRPAQAITTPELAAHEYDETKTGAILTGGLAIDSFVVGANVESSISSTAAGLISGLSLASGVHFAKLARQYRNRALELYRQEDGRAY